MTLSSFQRKKKTVKITTNWQPTEKFLGTCILWVLKKGTGSVQLTSILIKSMSEYVILCACLYVCNLSSCRVMLSFTWLLNTVPNDSLFYILMNSYHYVSNFFFSVTQYHHHVHNRLNNKSLVSCCACIKLENIPKIVFIGDAACEYQYNKIKINVCMLHAFYLSRSACTHPVTHNFYIQALSR